MSQYLQFFIWVPLIGFLVSFFIDRKRESIISGVAICTTLLNLAGIVIFIGTWLYNNNVTLDIKHIVVYNAGNIEIFLDLYFDKHTAVFAFVGSLLSFAVTIFSRFYLHREQGYKRFFNAIILFFLGYNLIVFSGNFETLFVGWEILGICSFLLITFYRDRYLPVKNGLKVISFYRLADVCLILAMWMSHHLWHSNITFAKLNNLVLVQEYISQNYSSAIFISIMILVAAAIKSAQLPFSSWLPRAMEGPTTSSAVFYGSLSVHLGVFILLRTFPFWESLLVIKIMVIVIGCLTAVIATGIARVQSSVKTQIAYSSAAQIGIMFIEVALGFDNIALIHFAGNAFLRTYQLLVSPSVLNYLVHDQLYNFTPRNIIYTNSIYSKITNSFYIMSVKEWNLDSLFYNFLWKPFKRVGTQLNFITHTFTLILLILVYAAGLYFFHFNQTIFFYSSLPIMFSFLALLLILKAFTERVNAMRGLLFVIASQFFIALSIGLNADFEFHQITIYLSGGVVSAFAGYLCLRKIRSFDNDIALDKFHGYAYEHPKIALVFLLSCLGLVAFPITPAFIGFDLLFTHIKSDQVILIITTSLCFVFIELSILRIYARIFLGQHKKTNHPIAYRSS